MSEDLVQMTAQDNGSVIGEPSDWQPIETAPKDGHRLLLWLADEQFWLIGKWDKAEEMWHLPEWDIWTGEEGLHWLTHWMRPASAPRSSEEPKQRA